jgi:hypothetical protein
LSQFQLVRIDDVKIVEISCENAAAKKYSQTWH